MFYVLEPNFGFTGGSNNVSLLSYNLSVFNFLIISRTDSACLIQAIWLTVLDRIIEAQMTELSCKFAHLCFLLRYSLYHVGLVLWSLPFKIHLSMVGVCVCVCY